MTEILSRLTEGDLLLVLMLAIAGAVAIVWAITEMFARIFGGADDLDEQTERIEQAIKDLAVDLLDALKAIETDTTAIRESNAYLEESERDFNAREGEADAMEWKAGASIHEMFVDLNKSDI